MFEELAEVINQLAIQLPDELINQLAILLLKDSNTDWQHLKTQLSHRFPDLYSRNKFDHLLDVWEKKASQFSPQSVGLALLTANYAEEHHRRSQSIDLVWTGPDSQIIPLRRIDQALLQLINEAQTSLTIVSFAVYKAGEIAQALLNAAQRNVTIDIILETPDASEGKITYDTVRALGTKITEYADFYVWPLEKRQVTLDGKHGSLHAKVAVADSEALLISSANLTDYAMHLNMEMGVMIRGGEQPELAEKHFRRLMKEGILKKLDFS